MAKIKRIKLKCKLFRIEIIFLSLLRKMKNKEIKALNFRKVLFEKYSLNEELAEFMVDAFNKCKTRTRKNESERNILPVKRLYSSLK